MSTHTLVTSAMLVDPVEGLMAADLRMKGGVIVEIGQNLPARDAIIVNAAGSYLLPGSIDAHSHADSRVLDDDVQEALLRQGVTTVIVGQDGVSYTPGDGGSYGSDYFGPINGAFRKAGVSVSEQLQSYRGTTRLNVGYLVPAGTVRHAVMGNSSYTPTAAQREAMVRLVAEGMSDGALGLSSGLDYVPGCFADAEELAALCEPVAAADGLYVSHIRGYEEKSPSGFSELERIAATSGVRAHVSHFHARAELVDALMSGAAEKGLDVSFDAYPYFRGFTLLNMLMLDKEIIVHGRKTAAQSLRAAHTRDAIRVDWAARWQETEESEEWWASRVQIASAGCPEWSWAEGLTLREAAGINGAPPLDTAVDLLADSELRTTVVVEIPKVRDDDALARQFALPGATVGSDGIYFGSAPHPRGWGTFARMYRRFVVERGDFTWPEMAMITSRRPAERFNLRDRGRVAVGFRADLVLLDPKEFRDSAGYHNPRALAEGVQSVYVAGQNVLGSSGLTKVLPGGPSAPVKECPAGLS